MPLCAPKKIGILQNYIPVLVDLKGRFTEIQLHHRTMLSPQLDHTQILTWHWNGQSSLTTADLI